MSVARFATWVLLLLAVVLSGVQVAYTSQEVRRLHVAREEAQRKQDEHLAEYSRLLTSFLPEAHKLQVPLDN